MPPLKNDKTGARPLIFIIPALGRAGDPSHSCASLGSQGKPGLVLDSSVPPAHSVTWIISQMPQFPYLPNYLTQYLPAPEPSQGSVLTGCVLTGCPYP